VHAGRTGGVINCCVLSVLSYGRLASRVCPDGYVGHTGCSLWWFDCNITLWEECPNPNTKHAKAAHSYFFFSSHQLTCKSTLIPTEPATMNPRNGSPELSQWLP
jgi:hypothetical protein